MLLTYEIFKQKAEEAKAKFADSKPKLAGLKVNPILFDKIKKEIKPESVIGDISSRSIVHNHLKITASIYVPENMILCVDAKGTIMGVVKIEKQDE